MYVPGAVPLGEMDAMVVVPLAPEEVRKTVEVTYEV